MEKLYGDLIMCNIKRTIDLLKSSLCVAPSVKDERVYAIAWKSLLQERK